MLYASIKQMSLTQLFISGQDKTTFKLSLRNTFLLQSVAAAIPKVHVLSICCLVGDSTLCYWPRYCEIREFVNGVKQKFLSVGKTSI